jgi:Subtilase family
MKPCANHRISLAFGGLLVMWATSLSGFAQSVDIDRLADISGLACVSVAHGAYFDPRKVSLQVNATGVSKESWRGDAATRWYTLPDGSHIKTFRFRQGGRISDLIIEAYDYSPRQRKGIANRGVRLDHTCAIVDRALVQFTPEGVPLGQSSVTPKSGSFPRTVVLNPPVPPAPTLQDVRLGIPVALVDSGINYLLAQIHSRLARDSTGQLIGYDFLDDDHQPFDEDYIHGALWFPLRHGTTVASILIGRNSQLWVAPYRHPATQVNKYQALIEHIARHRIRVANISIGGGSIEEWSPFYRAALQHPDILFVISAGNEGIDLDAQERYPASFKLPNSIVVAALDRNGSLLRSSNYGANTVDIAIKAQALPGFTFDGRATLLSGTSYAAPAISALAAELLSKNPNLSTEQLKAEIIRYAVMPPGSRHTKFGDIDLP